MTKAYSYIRMSTPEQKRGDSARRQIDATKAYTERNGLELVEIYSDIGVSAYRGQNAEFGALAHFLNAVEAGVVPRGSYLIVESLDRVSRQNVIEALQLMNRIVATGIVLVTLQDEQKFSKETITENSMNLMLALLTMLRAHEESKIKSARLTAVWGQKKLAATKGVPLGQKLPQWLRYNADKSAIEVIPDRVATVREIFELSRDGWGVYSIVRRFNEGGPKPWGKARYWQESYIKKILSNRAVLGEYQPFKKTIVDGKAVRLPAGEVIAKYYPKIISVGLFEQAQAARENRRISGKGRKGKGYSNLFTGLLRCAHCGGGIRYIDKGDPPKGGQYLRCAGAVVRGSCKARALRYEVVEQTVLLALEEIDFDYIFGGARVEGKKAKTREALAEVESEIAELEKAVSNLTNAIEATDQPIDALLTALVGKDGALNDARTRKAALEQQLQELTSPDPASQKVHLESLLLQIREEGGRREELRRSLASEIQRLITKIRIRIGSWEWYDFRQDTSIWPEAGKLSNEELMALCERYRFELTIHYRSGEMQMLDPLTNERLRFPASSKMNFLREKVRLGKL